MNVVRQPVRFHCMEKCEHCVTSSFVFNERKNIIQIWKDLRVSRWFMVIIFGWTVPLNCWIAFEFFIFFFVCNTALIVPITSWACLSTNLSKHAWDKMIFISFSLSLSLWFSEKNVWGIEKRKIELIVGNVRWNCKFCVLLLWVDNGKLLILRYAHRRGLNPLTHPHQVTPVKEY